MSDVSGQLSLLVMALGICRSNCVVNNGYTDHCDLRKRNSRIRLEFAGRGDSINIFARGSKEKRGLWRAMGMEHGAYGTLGRSHPLSRLNFQTNYTALTPMQCD
jgi:hypothetical protein